MNGLFRRLARHVVGPEPVTARSMARLPFAPPPDMLPAEYAQRPAADAPPEIAAVAATVPGSRREDPGSARAAAAEAPTPPQVRTAAAAAVVKRVPPPTAREEDPLPSATRRPADPAAGPPSASALPPEPAGGRPGTGAIPAPDTGSVPIASALRPAAPAAGVETPAVASPPALIPDGAGARDHEIRASERLPHAAPGTPESRRTATSSSAPPDEPTEVHVHIGHIEVTAIQEAAPSGRRSPRSGPQPMSLQEYLAKRQRGRS